MRSERDPKTWDAALYSRTSRYVSEHGRIVLEWLDPQAGERILDLGAGDGALTAEIAATGAEVVAVDASPAMVEAALERGLDARLVSGYGLDFDEEFDAVFSNAALHWMTQPEKVVRNVHRALRPQGRFVGEFGGAGNITSLCRALRRVLAGRGLEFDALNPWYFPTAEEYNRLLEECGFRVERAELIPRPTPIPGDVAEWLDNFGDPFLKALPRPEDRATVVREIEQRVRPALCDNGRWSIDYVRLRFRAWRV